MSAKFFFTWLLINFICGWLYARFYLDERGIHALEFAILAAIASAGGAIIACSIGGKSIFNFLNIQ